MRGRVVSVVVLLAAATLPSASGAWASSRTLPAPGDSFGGLGDFNTGPAAYGRYNADRGPGEGAAPLARSALSASSPKDIDRKPAKVTDRWAGLSPAADDIPAFRTEFSRTYPTPSGAFVTRVSLAPMHFKVNRVWQPVDERLVRRGSGFVNRAASYRATLPASLGDGPVVYRRGGRSVSLSVIGAADVPARVRGSAATYASAFRGVTVTFRTLSSGLKEDVVFADRRAARTISYRLELSRGLRPRLRRDGAVEIRDARGHLRFRLPAATMTDASRQPSGVGRVRARLLRVAGAWRLRLTPDRRWLASKGRKFPVTLDPQVTSSSAGDCTITDAAPNTAQCAGGSAYDHIGWNAGRYRSVFAFPVAGVLPANAQVLSARLAAYVASYSSPGAVVQVDAAALTSGAFDYHQVTWNSSKTGTPWATPGGDIAPVLSRSNWNVVGWNYAPITDMVQGWVDGSLPNYGVLLKPTTEGSGPALTAIGRDFAGQQYAPYIDIVYTQRLGRPRGTTFDDTSLTDRQGFGVNLANGNLTISSTDLAIDGTGVDQNVARTYNSMAGVFDEVGAGWNLSVGRHPRITGNGTDILYRDTDGGWYVFPIDWANGEFLTPPGIDKTLCVSNAAPCSVPGTMPGGYHLIARDGTKQLFASTGEQAAVTDRNGNAITMAFQHLNNRWSGTTDTRSRVITPTYDGNSQILTLTDNAYPGGRSTSYTYVNGYLTSATDADSKTTTYGYDSGLRINQITTPGGRVTKFTYDSAGRIASVLRVTNNQNQTGDTTTYTYQPPNTAFTGHPTGCPGSPTGANAYGLTTVTDARGKKTFYCNDTHDRTYTAFDANGNQRQAEYNKNDNVIKFTEPGGIETTTDFDDCYRPNKTTSPAAAGRTGASGKLDYENNTPSTCRFGFTAGTGGVHPYDPTKSTDAQDNEIAFGYDGANNPETATSQLPGPNNKITVHHAAKGLVDFTLDGNQHRTDYTYTTAGELQKITPPLPLGTTEFTPDAVSRPLTVKDGNARTTTYTYDKIDRVKTASYADGTSTSYTYDADGFVTQRADSNGTSNYTYDLKGRLLTEGSPGVNNTYTYDPNDNLATSTDGGGTTTYAYNDVNLVSSLTPPGLSAITFAYDDQDRRRCTTYPNGVAIQNAYSPSGGMTSTKAAFGACDLSSASSSTPTGTLLQSFVYTLAKPASPNADRELRYAVTDLAGKRTDYTYDALNRLTSAVTKNSGGTVVDSRNYTLDGAGNITARTINGSTTNLSYNDANEINSSGWGYDGEGNLTTKPGVGGATYAYNQRNQTTSITPSGGGAQTFAYLGPGQATLVSGNNATYTNNLLGISSQSTGCILFLCTVSYFDREPSGEVLAERVAGTPYYYLSDGLGSITGLTNSSGSVVNTYAYDPYGQITASGGTTSNPFGYVQGLNSAGGHVKFGERYYDPSAGRFTQPDPRGRGYAYADGDPVNRLDPDGLLALGVKVKLGPVSFSAKVGKGGASVSAGVGPELSLGGRITTSKRVGRTGAGISSTEPCVGRCKTTNYKAKDGYLEKEEGDDFYGLSAGGFNYYGELGTGD